VAHGENERALEDAGEEDYGETEGDGHGILLAVRRGSFGMFMAGAIHEKYSRNFLLGLKPNHCFHYAGAEAPAS
jgi:hypothetical protein